jgi:ribosomal protein L25 (general stress protein Ctc)
MAIELVAEPRTELGKEKCKKLRAQNILPANIYGGRLPEPQAISLNLHATEKLIKDHGKAADYIVVLGGEKYPVRIEEIHFEPVLRRFEHLDFVVLNNE